MVELEPDADDEPEGVAEPDTVADDVVLWEATGVVVRLDDREIELEAVATEVADDEDDPVAEDADVNEARADAVPELELEGLDVSDGFPVLLLLEDGVELSDVADDSVPKDEPLGLEELELDESGVVVKLEELVLEVVCPAEKVALPDSVAEGVCVGRAVWVYDELPDAAEVVVWLDEALDVDEREDVGLCVSLGAEVNDDDGDAVWDCDEVLLGEANEVAVAMPD